MTTEKTIGILLARMTSSRLPGKALRLVNGQPLLSYGIERLRAVIGVSEIWLATTDQPSDAPMIAWAQEAGIQTFAYSGDIDDVVGRVTAVVDAAQADRFLTVLGDSPFVDARLMQRYLAALDEHPDWGTVWLSPHDRPSAHCGIGCFRTSAWQKIDLASQSLSHREHLASILHMQPQLIHIGEIDEDPLYYEGPYRLSVDTEADLAFVNNVFGALQTSDAMVTFDRVLHYLRDHPEVVAMNQHVRQRTLADASCRVLFAVQAGGSYGTGHLSRCKTIAKMLEEYFSVGTSFWVENQDAEVIAALQVEHRNVLVGPQTLTEVLSQRSFHRVVIDYQTPLTIQTFTSIQGVHPDIPIVVLDNDGPGSVLADTVIFPNAHSQPQQDYQSGQCFQGAEYSLLGPAFVTGHPIQSTVKPNDIKHILITMGGTDPYGLTGKVLAALPELPNCHWNVVVPVFSHQAMGPNTDNITFHTHITNLAPLIAQSTIAIAAFGITVYELAYSGIPTLILGHNDYQMADIARFCAHGSAVSLGTGEALNTDTLRMALMPLLNSPLQYEAMSRHGQALLDGKGPYRVAERIMQTTSQKRLSKPLEVSC